MQITLNLGAMLRPDQFPHRGATLRMTRLVPMQLRRHGVETRLVISGEAVTASRTDPALLRALVRGYLWFNELASGRVVSTKQIAEREGLSDSYVRHVVPLGLLAPAIVESICGGRQSVSLSAERLKDHARLPVEWDAQQRLLSDYTIRRFRVQHRASGRSLCGRRTMRSLDGHEQQSQEKPSPSGTRTAGRAKAPLLVRNTLDTRSRR